jgi:transcriptional regulator with XRE-family HTH domain
VSTLLNAELIRGRRLELGLSERKLAAVTGLGQAVVRGIESATNHKDLTLGELQRLADALSLEATQLLARATEKETPAGPATRDEHLDHAVAETGALLHDIDRLIPVESLAQTLGHRRRWRGHQGGAAALLAHTPRPTRPRLRAGPAGSSGAHRSPEQDADERPAGAYRAAHECRHLRPHQLRRGAALR